MTAPLPPCTGMSGIRLMAAPGRRPTARGARLAITDGRIAGPDAVAPAVDPDLLVLPALVNAHDHGRGLRRHAYGAHDDALEAWLPASSALHPPVDPYLLAAVAFANMALSGVGTIVHCHMPQRWDRLIDEADAVCRAARDLGVRLAFVVPMADRNRLSYDGDEAILARLAPEDQAALRAGWLRPVPPPSEQVALVEAIAARCATENVSVQFGPFGAEWASDNLLERLAEASARTGLRVHMHCQETRLQRAWADRHHADGLFPHLDRLGLLSPRLTLAHCVWLRPDEAALAAARGVSFVINTSSNLRLRSGIAPVGDLLASGASVAFGIDALALDDDMDMLREMRLAYRLHNLPDDDPRLDLAALFSGGVQAGGRVALGRTDFGTLDFGAPADFMVLDYGALGGDLITDDPGTEEELLLARARREHVRDVVVAGRHVVRNGRVAGIDLPALTAELHAAARATAGEARAKAPLVARLQQAIRSHYGTAA